MPVNPSLKIHARLTPKLNFAAHQDSAGSVGGPALDNASRMVDRLVGRQRRGDREAGREAEDPDRIRSDDGPREKLTNSSYVKAPPEALSRSEP